VTGLENQKWIRKSTIEIPVEKAKGNSKGEPSAFALRAAPDKSAFALARTSQTRRQLVTKTV